MTVYRIAKWEAVFERAESRKLKQLHWVAMPIGFSSTGYQSMLDEFGDDAAAIYGAWCALTAIAASCAVRGILANSRGIPLKISHIARMTGLQSAVFEKLYVWAASPEVGWLEPVSEDDIAESYHGNAVSPGICTPSGESPDDLPTRQGNAPHTQQDITGHNRTKQSAAAEAAEKCGSGESPDDPPMVSRFRRLDADEVTRLANRLRKAGRTLQPEFVWQACCIGEVLAAGMIAEVCTKLSAGDIRKPKTYIEAALRKEAEAIGIDWKALVPLVPKPVFRKPVFEEAV